MQGDVISRLAEIRRKRGIPAAELARRVGSSRQTIYAIEAGSFVPNTELTLRLARELEVAVEELFRLGAGPAQPAQVSAELLSERPVFQGQAVRVCQVGERILSVPVSASPYYLPEADGIVAAVGEMARDGELMLFAPDEDHQKKLVIAGCDPAIRLLSGVVERISGVEVVPAAAASKLALRWLAEGKVHVAGTHLEDAVTGEFNLPYLRREYPKEDLLVVTFARWEEGLVVAPGNPKSVRRVADLANGRVRFMNRETGSGSRALLDRVLGEASVPTGKVNGYERLAYGHLPAAYAVYAGEADCCVAARSAARAFGLDFVALQSERYDFVMRRDTSESLAAQALLDVLQRASLRRKLEVLAGYDTTDTGRLLT